MKATPARSVARYAAVTVLVVGLVSLYRFALHVNPTTVALTFLLAVLIVSAFWGLRYSVVMAALATLAFNYNFLPPYGTFTIADPQNWVALFVFLITAILASQLSERARRETENANQRRRDVERLYTLSQRLLATDNIAELLNAIPVHLAQIFQGRSGAVYVLGSDAIYRSSAQSEAPSAENLKLVSARGEPVLDRTREESLAPLRLGTRVTGALGISGALLSRGTLEALGSLVAIAVERVGVIEKLGKAEALRESETLRTALLDSVTHELRTPLTGIKAAVTSLLSGYSLEEAERRDLLSVINEETDRLDRLVGEATEMSQFDALGIELQLEPVSMPDLAASAIEQLRGMLGQHPIEIRVPQPVPNVTMDAARITEVLKHLLENAAKYSLADAPVTITIEVKKNRLLTSVADRGPGVDDFEQALIFDKFYRGRDLRYRVQGTGMGLAIAKAIVEAHEGTIGVTSQLGHGSVFYIELPVA